MVKKILYIDHEFHKKTKSNLFLVDLLRERYIVDYITFNPETNKYDCDRSIFNKEYDSLILFQVIVDMVRLKKIFHYSNLIFVPMYDGVYEFPDSFWINYKECNIINFSKNLHEKLQGMGLSTNYIQFFPKPMKYVEGKENQVYFWQRTPNITLDLILRLLENYDIEKIHIHAVLDSGNCFSKPFKEVEEKYQIDYSSWYDSKEDMISDQENYAFYIAPREYEGIGMSFLEAMAMGKVVIAPNSPTMNEYIESEENGFLYDLKDIKPLKKVNIRQIQRNTYEYMCEGYKEWQESKYDILRWVLEKPQINEEIFNKKFVNTIIISKHFLFNKLILTCEKDKKYKLFGKLRIPNVIAIILFDIYFRIRNNTKVKKK